MSKKKILVVLGGTSKERQVSLETGASCINSLKKSGYKVSRFDPKFSSITEIKKNKVDVIFNALHGKGGEDNQVWKNVQNMACGWRRRKTSPLSTHCCFGPTDREVTTFAS